MNTNEDWPNHEDVTQVTAVLDEWQQLVRLLLTLPSQPALSWRGMMERLIRQGTQNRACLCWEQPATALATAYDRWFSVTCGKYDYGWLGLAPGYLASSFFPSAPQLLAQLCGLVLRLAECQTLVHYQLHQMPAVTRIEPLTPREQEMLLSLARNESEEATAGRLGITLETVRKHRRRLYEHLGVHTAYQAVLHAFALGLLDLLDFPCEQ
jgi:DNA-binding CsgD family transcriptional regulator